MIKDKTIALIAHDRRKADMVDWVKHNTELLVKNKLVCTGTTGKLVQDTINEYFDQKSLIYEEIYGYQLNIQKMNSGPMGGDAEIASMVVKGQIDMCVFLIDDLNANPHEADIQMLLRQCRVHNIPVACNRHTADLMITSDLWGTEYLPTKPTYVDFNRDEL